MERRNGRTGDLEIPKLIFVMAITAMVCGLIMAIILGLSGPVIDSDRKDRIAYNRFVEIYNAMSEEDREMLAPYIKYTRPKGQTYFDMKEEIPDGYAQEWRKSETPDMIRWIVITLSVACFIWYVRNRDTSYRMSDLPFNHVIGWLLLLLMFAAWPILFIDRVILQIKGMQSRRAERLAIKQEAERKVKEEEELPFNVLDDAKARKYYVEYVTRWNQKACEERKSKLVDEESTIEQRLKICAENIRRYQNRRGEIRAELKKYEKVETRDEIERKVEEEWDAIREMRGVMGASVKKVRGKKSKELIIYVRVQVSYKDELYDFGDYQIRLKGKESYCFCVRSGIRKDATSTAPSYGGHVGNSFCFGSRRQEIGAYVATGRYVEAVTLMIDCLHSVNDPEAEARIPYCFRKIKTVERAKKRLAKT